MDHSYVFSVLFDLSIIAFKCMVEVFDRGKVHIRVKNETDRGSREIVVLKIDGTHFQGRVRMIIIISSISNNYYY